MVEADINDIKGFLPGMLWSRVPAKDEERWTGRILWENLWRNEA